MEIEDAPDPAPDPEPPPGPQSALGAWGWRPGKRIGRW